VDAFILGLPPLAEVVDEEDGAEFDIFETHFLTGFYVFSTFILFWLNYE